MTNNTNTNTNAKEKTITVTMGDGAKRNVAISGIRYVKIVNGPAGEEPGQGGFQSKLFIAGESEPVYARESVKELRSDKFELVYVGDGKYVVRGHIARLEPLTKAERQAFASQKNAPIDDGFVTRVVLHGDLGQVWGKKSIDELNARGLRFVGLGDGSAVHMANIRKISALFDEDRARIAAKYGDNDKFDAAAFKAQIELQGAMKPKLAKRSIEEFREDGLELVDVGAGQYVLKTNIKFFGPFDAQNATLREGSDAEKYAAKITLANNGTVLSVLPVEHLKEVTQAVNIGYDRFVPADLIVPEKVTALTKEDKARMSEREISMDRAWKSSVGLVNSRMLSPATPDQIRARVDKAKGQPGASPAASEGAGPEAAMG